MHGVRQVRDKGRLTVAPMREKGRFRFLKECSGACGDLDLPSPAL
jgi:hypothetical protein